MATSFCHYTYIQLASTRTVCLCHFIECLRPLALEGRWPFEKERNLGIHIWKKPDLFLTELIKKTLKNPSKKRFLMKRESSWSIRRESMSSSSISWSWYSNHNMLFIINLEGNR